MRANCPRPLETRTLVYMLRDEARSSSTPMPLVTVFERPSQLRGVPKNQAHQQRRSGNRLSAATSSSSRTFWISAPGANGFCRKLTFSRALPAAGSVWCFQYPTAVRIPPSDKISHFRSIFYIHGLGLACPSSSFDGHFRLQNERNQA